MHATFATIAEELVSGGVLKRMINYVTNNDVTLGHYVGEGEAQLLAGWQTVADFIDNAAAEETARLAALVCAVPPSANTNVDDTTVAQAPEPALEAA